VTSGGHHRIAEGEVDRLLAPTAVAPSRAERERTGAIVSISGRNQLRGYVDEVRVEGLLAQVRLRIGDQTLTAIITRDAVEELKLRRGDEALAVVKATEVMVAREAVAPAPSPKRSRVTRRAKAEPGGR
jgi:molybdopterin-binding protein